MLRIFFEFTESRNHKNEVRNSWNLVFWQNPARLHQIESQSGDAANKMFLPESKYQAIQMFWYVGMKFWDAGCVRISFAINSKSFSDDSDWRSIDFYCNLPKIIYWPHSGPIQGYLSIFFCCHWVRRGVTDRFLRKSFKTSRTNHNGYLKICCKSQKMRHRAHRNRWMKNRLEILPGPLFPRIGWHLTHCAEMGLLRCFRFIRHCLAGEIPDTWDHWSKHVLGNPNTSWGNAYNVKPT